MDIRPFIAAKSDQLNADDLLGGPITVRVEGVGRGNADQPVSVRISGGHCPWRPSKTSLRVLAHCWGTDASQWVGRWVRLYRDPTVLWAGKPVGGIRVQAVSHIHQPQTLALAVTRGKKRQHRIEVLRSADQAEQGAPTADLEALLEEHGLTPADCDRWLAAEGRPSLAEVDPEKRAALAAWLAADPTRIAAIAAASEEE